MADTEVLKKKFRICYFIIILIQKCILCHYELFTSRSKFNLTYAWVVALVRFPPLAEHREVFVLEEMFHIVFGIAGQQSTTVLFQ